MTPGLEVTTCDCTKPIHKRFVHFQDYGCHSDKPLQPERTTDHMVYSYEEETIQFPGYICSMWYREAEVEGGVIYGTKTVLYGRESMNTSPEECWKMKEFKMCGEQQMKQHSIDTWGWEAQPSQEVTWMSQKKNSIASSRKCP